MNKALRSPILAILLAATSCAAPARDTVQRQQPAYEAQDSRGTQQAATAANISGGSSSQKLSRSTSRGERSKPASRNPTGRAARPTAQICVIQDDAADVVGGLAPGYADIRKASLRLRRSHLLFGIRVDGDFPDQLPEGDNLIIGIGLEATSHTPAAAVVAQATSDGWSALLRVGQRQFELNDEFTVARRTLTWTIDKETVSDAKQLEWGASLRWFRFYPGQAPTEGVQRADRAPEDGPAMCSVEQQVEKGGTR